MHNQIFIILRTKNTGNKRCRESVALDIVLPKFEDGFCIESRAEMKKFEKAINLRFRCTEICTMSSSDIQLST